VFLFVNIISIIVIATAAAAAATTAAAAVAGVSDMRVTLLNWRLWYKVNIMHYISSLFRGHHTAVFISARIRGVR